jgi:hypothetical protein
MARTCAITTRSSASIAGPRSSALFCAPSCPTSTGGTSVADNTPRAYDALLADLPVERPELISNGAHIYHQYVIRTAERDRVQAALAERGIGTGVHYPIPVHLQPACVDLGYRRGDLPVTEQLADEILSLPMYPDTFMPPLSDLKKSYPAPAPAFTEPSRSQAANPAAAPVAPSAPRQRPRDGPPSRRPLRRSSRDTGLQSERDHAAHHHARPGDPRAVPALADRVAKRAGLGISSS